MCIISTSLLRITYIYSARIGIIPIRLFPKNSCIDNTSGSGYALILTNHTIWYVIVELVLDDM